MANRLLPAIIVFAAVAVSIAVSTRFIRRDTVSPVGYEATVQDITPAVPSGTPYQELTFKSVRFAYVMIAVKRADTVALIPNFRQKKAAFELAGEAECVAYANGSFYDTHNTPLGMFESDGEILKSRTTNSLLNGFLWQRSGTSRGITAEPATGADWQLQTGPVLISERSVLTLSIRDDEPARRVAAMTDAGGGLYFITVFTAESILTGPQLEDLPEIVSEIASKTGISPLGAVNLDGGSASAFFDGTHTVSEFTPVGSLFCIRS